MLRWIAILCLISTLTYGQTEKVEKKEDAKKDATSNETVAITDVSGPTHVRFDEAFPMSYTPVKKKKISSITLFQIDKCGCFVPFKCCECRSKGMRVKRRSEKAKRRNEFNDLVSKKVIDLTKEISNPSDSQRTQIRKNAVKAVEDSITAASVEVKEPSRKNTVARPYIVRHFVQIDSSTVNFVIPALPPNKRFLISIDAVQKPTGIDQVIDSLFKGNKRAADSLYKIIAKNTLYTPSTGTLCPSGCTNSFSIQSFPKFYKELYDSLIKSKMDSLALVKAEKERKKQIPPLKPIQESFDANLVKSVVTFSQECLACPDSLLQQTWLSSNRVEMSNALMNFEILNSTELSSGLVQLNRYLTTPTTKGVTLKSRIDNIKISIELLGQSIAFIRYYSLKTYGSSPPSGYTSLNQSLIRAKDALKANYESLTKHKAEIDSLEKLEKRLIRSKDLELGKWYGFRQVMDTRAASTFTYNFDTRAGYALKADFGFLVYGGRSDYKDLRGLAPFVGFHVNFRPMNTDVPFREIKCKGIWGHLSFHSGALIGSFKQGEDIDGLIKGTAVFTGFGYAFGHAVRAQVGAVWFRQKDPNPLVTDMSVSAVPYAGLALDLRLNDIFESFTSIFKP